MVKECLVFLDVDVKDMDEFLETASNLIYKTKLIENRDEFHKAIRKRKRNYDRCW